MCESGKTLLSFLSDVHPDTQTLPYTPVSLSLCLCVIGPVPRRCAGVSERAVAGVRPGGGAREQRQAGHARRGAAHAHPRGPQPQGGSRPGERTGGAIESMAETMAGAGGIVTHSVLFRGASEHEAR